MNEAVWRKQTAPVGRPPMNGGTAGPDGAKLLHERSLRQLLAEHPGMKDLRAGSRASVQIDLPYLDFKTLVTLSNASPQAERRGLVTMALEERTVGDMMLQGETSSNQVEYYEETAVSNNAATVAEGIAKAESALGWTLRNEPIRKIATWIPATDEVLSDVPFMESQIRGRLSYMVQRVEERQLLNGNGVAPNILGILQRPGIQTQAKGADPTPDAIYKAMQKIRGAAGAGFAEPTDVVLHPNDWTDIRLLRTADGIYIWGNPSDPGPERIWGKSVRQTTEITEGTGLVGAFRPFSEVLRRAGIAVTMSTEHASYFIENKVAILAEERLGLAVYRPSAFCTVTGV
jgi:HK97 family phage major capsid protein